MNSLALVLRSRTDKYIRMVIAFGSMMLTTVIIILYLLEYTKKKKNVY